MNYQYSLGNNPKERISQYVEVIKTENAESSANTRGVSESDDCRGEISGVDGLKSD
jgi:hypothetical protein